MARKPQRYHCQKTAIIFFISTGIFASEPMTLPEIDHVSFVVEHAQTFFAGEWLFNSPYWRMRKQNALLLSDNSSADEAKRMKSAGKPKPAPSSSTVTKSSKKAPKKSNKRSKSLSEEEMERFPFLRWAPTHFASIFRNALDLFTLSLPFARHVLHGV